MGFLDSLKKMFTVPSGREANFIIFKVKCKKCGEEIEVKVRKTSDISRVYENEGPSGAAYFLRKEILGKNCNNLIYVTIYFGPDYGIISRDISGGNFLD
ncbi:MAG: hypothetical protein ACQEP2_04690 [Actinomycetota bacterium]